MERRTIIGLGAILSWTLVFPQTDVEARLRKDIQHLASVQLQGRGNGEPGLEQAAQYLSQRYKNMGLKTEIQHYPFLASVALGQAKALLCKGDSEPLSLEWGKDCQAMGFSADAHFRPSALVFAGYGLSTESYNDFRGIEVKDRVVLIAREIPDLPAFVQLPHEEKSLLSRIQRLARLKARAVLVLEASAPQTLRKESPSKLDIPVLSVKTSALTPVCGDLNQHLERIRETGNPQSQDFIYAPWSTLSLELKLERRWIELPNVLAYLPGSDPKLKHEHLVLGAHFDHLGLGGSSSLSGKPDLKQVHPGADDNASGTAVLMELARTLKTAPPKRSIVFLHVSGEEVGVLGSSHWVRNPTVPMETVKFMFNFDMVGRLHPDEPKLFLGALGTPKEETEHARVLAPKGLHVSAQFGDMLTASDSINFVAAKIPTYFFFTGVHGDYHRPSDTADKLNYPGLATLTQYAHRLVQDLGNRAQSVSFDPETAKVSGRTRGPMKIHFGTIPDHMEHPKGFRINGVTPGSTAEICGLQSGDIIIRIGEHPVRSIHDYMAAFSRLNPGDVVRVVWLRGDQEMSAQATLKARK